jgi:hypothetical protein
VCTPGTCSAISRAPCGTWCASPRDDGAPVLVTGAFVMVTSRLDKCGILRPESKDIGESGGHTPDTNVQAGLRSGDRGEYHVTTHTRSYGWLARFESLPWRAVARERFPSGRERNGKVHRDH